MKKPNSLVFKYICISKFFKMLKYLRISLIITFTFVMSISSHSQNFSDISSINFSELNNSQIDLLLRRAGSQGYSQFDLLKMAKDQGMDPSKINELDKKFKSTETIARVAQNASTPLEDTRMRQRWVEEMEVFRQMKDSDIFGFNV